MKTPAQIQEISKALKALPVPTYQLNVHQHNQTLTEQIQKIIRQFVPKEEKAPNKPYISKQTRTLVQQKKQMLKTIRRTQSDDEELQYLLAERRLHERTLQQQIKADKQRYIEELALEAQTCYATHNHKQLYEKVNKLTERQPKKSTARWARPYTTPTTS